jgi:hypothetical protein
MLSIKLLLRVLQLFVFSIPLLTQQVFYFIPEGNVLYLKFQQFDEALPELLFRVKLLFLIILCLIYQISLFKVFLQPLQECISHVRLISRALLCTFCLYAFIVLFHAFLLQLQVQQEDPQFFDEFCHKKLEASLINLWLFSFSKQYRLIMVYLL